MKDKMCNCCISISHRQTAMYHFSWCLLVALPNGNVIFYVSVICRVRLTISRWFLVTGSQGLWAWRSLAGVDVGQSKRCHVVHGCPVAGLRGGGLWGLCSAVDVTVEWLEGTAMKVRSVERAGQLIGQTLSQYLGLGSGLLLHQLYDLLHTFRPACRSTPARKCSLNSNTVGLCYRPANYDVVIVRHPGEREDGT